MKKIAAYGSLKRGFHNFGACGEQKFLGTIKLDGVMFLPATYPRLVKQHPDYAPNTHELEVFEVSEETYSNIVSMEVGAGYSVEDVETPFGPATIFWSKYATGHHIEKYDVETIRSYYPHY